MTPKHLLNSLAQRDTQYSLPRDFYCDDDVYQTDLEYIWYRSWIFAGHTCELIQPSDRITLPLGAYAISIRREANGVFIGEFDTEQTTEDTKRPIHCQAVEGYLFISLAEQPDDFDAFKKTITPYMQPHQVDQLKLVAESSIIEHGNWKLVFENNRECYHCASNHPELTITYPETPTMTGDANLPKPVSELWQRCEADGLPSRFYIAEDTTYRIVRLPLLQDFTSFTMNGYDAVSKRMPQLEGKNVGSLLLFHYPSTWNHLLGDYLISFRVLPISPQATQVTTKWLVHPDAVEGKDFDQHNLTHVWHQTNAQDKHLVEENQKGINSPLYEPGPYNSVDEGGVMQFVNWYSRLLQQRMA